MKKEYEAKKKEIAGSAKVKGSNWHPDYHKFRDDWKKSHGISPPPSHSSWKSFYRGK